MGSPNGGINSVRTALEILETVKDYEGMRLVDIAEEMDMPKSSVHRYLKTLEQKEYLIRRGNKYLISGKFLHFAHRVYHRDPAYQMVEEKIDHLAEETDELVQFLIEEHGRIVYVFQATGGQGIQIDTESGGFGHLHSTAGGKAILSTWTDEEVKAYVERRGLPQITPHTITNIDDLFSEIRSVHSEGYAINDEENIEGVRAIAVPIKRDQKAIGAICISGPINRMKGQVFTEELPDLLLGVENELELNFRFL